MPSITASPQPMLMARNDPLAFLLSTVCATTPTPNAIRMKVPKNSAAASRAVPLSIRGFYPRRRNLLFVIRYSLFHRAQHDDVLPWQDVNDPIDGEALCFQLRLHLRHAH